ncbi:MAG: DegT/DnrJ/EryC1/StrS family aminotransferase [bacterium]|nr:DegT/DnrJ/EryC1/StrS family aminotransferase [bacterium]
MKNSRENGESSIMKRLAIHGGIPVRSEKSFPAWPVFGHEERARLMEVFESGKWWYGEKVKEFEEKYAAFHDAKYSVTCTNGTAALETALLACGIGAGDEVIVPPYTFIATASAVLKANAIPVFADIEPDTCNLDPEDVERKITDKTRAIIPVHLGGLPVDMDAFCELAKKYNLVLIEDACHSWGSKWQDKGTGAIGDCGVFSFQMSKNITSGEGGILLTDNGDIADRARSYTDCGRIKGGAWYEHYFFGSNLRMTELQAGILLGQLERLEEQTLKRERNAAYLGELLQDIPGIGLMRRDPRVTRRSYHMYIFRFLSEQWPGVSRDRFLEALRAEGIPCSSGYPKPLYKNHLYQQMGEGAASCPVTCPYHGRTVDYGNVMCPNTELICREACWIPHTVLLAEEPDMKDIAEAIKKIWEHRKELSDA